jgi:hypothetical protein
MARKRRGEQEGGRHQSSKQVRERERQRERVGERERTRERGKRERERERERERDSYRYTHVAYSCGRDSFTIQSKYLQHHLAIKSQYLKCNTI